MSSSGQIGTAQRAAAERVLCQSYQINDRKDNVISDLLYALRRSFFPSHARLQLIVQDTYAASELGRGISHTMLMSPVAVG